MSSSPYENSRKYLFLSALHTITRQILSVFFVATEEEFLRNKIRGPRGILCTRGEKAHTSKIVSVIAPDNTISKAKCATRGRPHKKGVRDLNGTLRKQHSALFLTYPVQTLNVIPRSEATWESPGRDTLL